MTEQYVLELYFADSGAGQIIGPFHSPSAAKNWASCRFPKVPVVSVTDEKPAGTRLELVRLTEPR